MITVIEYTSVLGDGDLRGDSGPMHVGWDLGTFGEGENPQARNVGRRRGHSACKSSKSTAVGGCYPLPECVQPMAGRNRSRSGAKRTMYRWLRNRERLAWIQPTAAIRGTDRAKYENVEKQLAAMVAHSYCCSVMAGKSVSQTVPSSGSDSMRVRSHRLV